MAALFWAPARSRGRPPTPRPHWPWGRDHAKGEQGRDSRDGDFSAEFSLARLPVTFTATVLPTSPGAGTPTGTVTFYDGSTVLGTETLNGSGQATLTITWKTTGTHNIKVKYSGDLNFDTITSSVMTETVT